MTRHTTHLPLTRLLRSLHRAALLTALFTLATPSCRDRQPTGSPSASSRAHAGPDQDPNRPPTPLRAEPTRFDLGNAPVRNPLNLHDIGITGGPDHETVGTVDGVPITTSDLESHSVGAFSRIAARLYQARDTGYRWLIERTALNAMARAANRPLLPFLLHEYGLLPAPTDAELDAILARSDLPALSPEERRLAAVSLWRLAAWNARRDELILAGRSGLSFTRVRQRITTAQYARPETVVARLGDHEITRADVRALAGYQAMLARHEYWRIARLQFERYVPRFLLEREAGHLGITVDELLRRERAGTAEVRPEDVRAFIAENPEYGRDEQGYERAADNVRRLRVADAEQALEARLRDTSEIRFLLHEPEFDAIRVEVPGPRWHGPPDAENTIVAFHSLGCKTCTRGTQLLLAVIARYPGRLRLLAGDYFESGQLASYRGALALHCAPPDQRDALLATLADDFGTGEISDLVARATAAGVDTARFQPCLLADRLLPVIVENLAISRRLGLERNVAGLFANGRRISDLEDLDGVIQQIQHAIASP